MKKIEVCAPFESVEPLQIELAAAGILVQAGLTLPCGSFQTDLPLGEKPQKSSLATQCKIELIVSNRLAPRTIEIITDLLHARNWKASLNHFIVLDVEGSYRFEPASERPLAPKLDHRAHKNG